jgi:Na+-driven multidrug efflux pump
VKDMNVQLLGSLAYLAALVAADALLLFGPPALGMEGAGLGAAAAQWAGAITVCALLHRKQVGRRAWAGRAASSRMNAAQPTPPPTPPAQIFNLRDMAALPGPADVRPYARMTGSLVLNNLSALLPTLVATSAATGLGVQHLGAHTILRQLMGFWLQVRHAAGVRGRPTAALLLSSDGADERRAAARLGN